MSEEHRSGFVALIGRPNVGKSTFINAAIGQKIAIVTSHPQTTRKRMLGIKTMPHAQVVFVDTPGIHRAKHKLGDYMNREADEAIRNVDAVVMMVEPREPRPEEWEIAGRLRDAGKPVLLVINKADSVKDKAELLPVIDAWRGVMEFADVFPVSALRNEGVAEVIESAARLMPTGPKLYADDLVTDSLERHIVAEIVREKVMLSTGDEVPHSVAVEVVEWDEDDRRIVISADIYVEKSGQKGIIIGKGGQKLKQVGTEARRDIEDMLGTKVFLKLFVKVREGWRGTPSILDELGFGRQ